MIENLIKSLNSDENYRYSWVANIAMSFKDEYARTEDKSDIHSIANRAAENFINLLTAKTEDYIEVAERLYRHINPESKMCTPNSVYETTEKWYGEWRNKDTELDLFNWILENKQ